MTATATTASTPDYDEIVRVVQLYFDGFNNGAGGGEGLLRRFYGNVVDGEAEGYGGGVRTGALRR
jgi:hypothetical protein